MYQMMGNILLPYRIYDFIEYKIQLWKIVIKRKRKKTKKRYWSASEKNSFSVTFDIYDRWKYSNSLRLNFKFIWNLRRSVLKDTCMRVYIFFILFYLFFYFLLLYFSFYFLLGRKSRIFYYQSKEGTFENGYQDNVVIFVFILCCAKIDRR